MRIALDAMGGDYAPREIVKGAIEAVQKCDCEIVLVGDEEIIKQELQRAGASDEFPIFIKHAPDVVGMGEPPSMALRKKKQSSIWRAVEMVKRGKAHAVVSAGNTGAVMVSAKLQLRTLEGVSRPAIAVTLPSRKDPFLLLDAGANVDSKPENLLEFAIMGHLYAKHILGIERPRVGLLSIGEEDTKGDSLVKQTYPLLRQAPQLHFIGNVEGKEIYNNVADVVVCDGFAGNLALKISESAAGLLLHLLKEAFVNGGLRAKIGYWAMKPFLKEIKVRTDYKEYGGAPLLGVNGICIISHGSSDAKAITNAIRVAKELATNQLNRHIQNHLAVLRDTPSRRFWDKLKETIPSWRDEEEEEGNEEKGASE